VAEARYVGQYTSFEDRRMWRLLLAQLHPDAGGSHELFTFACAVKEEVCGKERPKGENACHREPRVEHFLREWQDAINHWAVSNREALKTFQL
jgi:hypothetical protein